VRPPQGMALPPNHPIENVSVEVNYSLQLKIIINQADMSANGDVAMVGRGRWQLTLQVPRHRVNSSPEILVERSPLSEARFLI